jgi:hypothetical protein
MNVKMTFLNRDLKEKVYMEQTESYTSKWEKKSLYIGKIFIWFKASSETMAWEVWQSNFVKWLSS